MKTFGTEFLKFYHKVSVASSHLYGGGDSFRKWKDFQLSIARDLDLALGHTVILHIVVHHLIDLYLHTKFHALKSK